MLGTLVLAAALLAPAAEKPRAAKPQAAKSQAAKPKPGARTAAAVSPRVAAEFKASDANGDGALSRAEVLARVKRMDVGSTRMSPEQVEMLASAWFARTDANRDGKVTPAEMQRLLTAIARRYDANGDGVVSVSEREAARAATLNEVGSARAKER